MKYPPRVSRDLWEKMKPLARELRSAPTPAEEGLWQHLRRRQVGGVGFRRQHVFERFVVDFYCPSAALVIEVDGPVHLRQQEADAIRTEFLESRGLHVVRFTNEQVFTDLDGVMQTIAEALEKSSFAP